MASYAAAVDIFRSSAAAAAAAGGSGIEGVAAEDMAAMQALMEEDENSPDAFAMAEDESLDYDVCLLCSINDVETSLLGTALDFGQPHSSRVDCRVLLCMRWA